MSDERKPLEMTNEQAMELVNAVNRLHGLRLGETIGTYAVLVLWPLIRDYALEEAAKACEAEVAKAAPPMISGSLCHEDQLYCLGLKRAAELARVMKGKP